MSKEQIILTGVESSDYIYFLKAATIFILISISLYLINAGFNEDFNLPNLLSSDNFMTSFLSAISLITAIGGMLALIFGSMTETYYVQTTNPKVIAYVQKIQAREKEQRERSEMRKENRLVRRLVRTLKEESD